MNAKDPDVLGRALAKQASGRGTSNTEKRALSDYARGKIGRDHFAAIPVRDTQPLWQQSSTNPHPNSIERVDGLQAALRKSGNGTADTSALEARIADLEALLSGLTRQSVSYCSGGSTTTKTMLMS